MSTTGRLWPHNRSNKKSPMETGLSNLGKLALSGGLFVLVIEPQAGLDMAYMPQPAPST